MTTNRIPIDMCCEKKISTIDKDTDCLIDYVDISSVDNSEKKIVSFKTIDAKEAPSRARQLINKNDIIVSTVRPNLKPVLYYTNGYVTKVIDGLYPDREVMAFHTIEELELMIQRRNRGNIVDMKIDDNITSRPYQKMAITNLCEWLNKKHRRGLLVMATGMKL